MQISDKFYYVELPEGAITQSINNPQNPSIESKVDQHVQITIQLETNHEIRTLPQERFTWIQNLLRDDDPEEGNSTSDRCEEKAMLLGTVCSIVLIVGGFLYTLIHP